MESLLNYRPGSVRQYAHRQKPMPVNFVCWAPAAQRVSIVGDFNQWNPGAHPMHRQPDGAWTLQLQIGHGHHHYQFLVDGQPMLDPQARGIARNAQGEKVSLLSVS